MTAFEIYHTMKQKKRGRSGWVAMKLDMSKAYDRVEWDFLEATMLKMGFCNKWTQLVMRCVTTVSYSVLLNGSPSKAFSPEKGLRQGDRLSPYLLILCADVLSCLLKRAESNGELHGVKVTRNAPAVSHLFFADDSILFFKENRQELSNVQKVIQEYEMASGQRINMDKTEITASGNVSESLIAELCETVGVRHV